MTDPMPPAPRNTKASVRLSDTAPTAPSPAHRSPGPKLALVVPCFNEAAQLPTTFRALSAKLSKLVADGSIHSDSFVLFVDDGSSDETWDQITAQTASDPRCQGLRLVVNVGQQTAIFAGLQAVALRCDAALSLDADLQDDLNAIEAMLAHLAKGAEIVLGVRSDRDSDSWFKRSSARMFYRFARTLNVRLTADHADYRLMARPVLLRLMQFGEQDLFLRATPGLLSGNVAVVRYRRLPRAEGQSHYPLSRMLGLGWTGISSFSLWPLRLITLVGLLTSALSVLLTVYAVLSWASGNAIAGWTSIFVALTLFSGLTLLALGIIGEYVAKIYREVVRRPRYFVEQSTWHDEENAADASSKPQSTGSSLPRRS